MKSPQARRRLWLVLFATLPGIVAWKVVRNVRANATTLIRATGTDTPDPNVKGNPEDAMRRARVLMDYLQKNNFPYNKDIPHALLTLPDQALSEIPDDRPGNAKRPGSKYEVFIPAFGIGNPIEDLDRPEIAFTCDTYLRRNISVYKDGHYTTQPGGFVIVGFRDGRITKVPPQDIRLIANSNFRQSAVNIYPGCMLYRADLPKLPYVDSSKENNAKIDAEFAKAGKYEATMGKRAAMGNNQTEEVKMPSPAACKH